MDDRGQHESAPRTRGARYYDGMKAVADWGAQFMVDPDVEELSGNGA